MVLVPSQRCSTARDLWNKHVNYWQCPRCVYMHWLFKKTPTQLTWIYDINTERMLTVRIVAKQTHRLTDNCNNSSQPASHQPARQPASQQARRPASQLARQIDNQTQGSHSISKINFSNNAGKYSWTISNVITMCLVNSCLTRPFYPLTSTTILTYTCNAYVSISNFFLLLFLLTFSFLFI